MSLLSQLPAQSCDKMNRIMPPTLDQATIATNESPRYDAAYLKELKAGTPTARPPTPSKAAEYDADISINLGDISMQTFDMDVGTYRLPCPQYLAHGQ